MRFSKSQSSEGIKRLCKAEQIMFLENAIQNANGKINVLLALIVHPEVNKSGKRTIDLIIERLNGLNSALTLFQRINDSKFIKVKELYHYKIELLHMEIWLLSWLKSNLKADYKMILALVSTEIDNVQDRRKSNLKAFCMYLAEHNFKNETSRTHSSQLQALNILNENQITMLKRLVLKHSEADSDVTSSIENIKEKTKLQGFYQKDWERIERSYLTVRNFAIYQETKIKIFSNTTQLISNLFKYKKDIDFISRRVSSDKFHDEELPIYIQNLKVILTFLNYNGYDNGMVRLGEELDTILNQSERSENLDLEIL